MPRPIALGEFVDAVQIAALTFPNIDPVAIRIEVELAIRWYALAYISGLLLGWAYIVSLLRRPPRSMTSEQVGDFLGWAVVGIVIGGRLGYVLFYNRDHYLANPNEIFAIWQGGMSFHGGFVGMLLAMETYARGRNLSFLALADLVACATPIGLGLGRLANFINGELFGRVSDVPWAMVFPRGGDLPRHPSQLYEATLEGIVLFLLLFCLARFTDARSRPGVLGGTFLLVYGIGRVLIEFVREPDAHLGLRYGVLTMGQILSLPLIVAGAWLIARGTARAAPQTAP
ncbi:MAG: prolipoprotein diacylglyceryl transferase [Alphaproteobacteria bacterium]|nr:prolipoprotein diacylglyceryl transferase [Alphaproteobacteria bacterium]